MLLLSLSDHFNLQGKQSSERQLAGQVCGHMSGEKVESLTFDCRAVSEDWGHRDWRHRGEGSRALLFPASLGEDLSPGQLQPSGAVLGTGLTAHFKKGPFHWRWEEETYSVVSE